MLLQFIYEEEKRKPKDGHYQMKIFKFLGKIYKGISPYIVPALLALTLFFAFKPAETIEVPKIQTITSTITLPAEVDTMYVTLRDTLRTTNTVLDTMYLPGERILVPVASADTTFIFLSSDKDIMVEAKVGVGAKYFGDPLNEFKLSARLDDIQLFLPDRMTKTTYFTSGIYLGTDKVYASMGVLHKSNHISVLYDGKKPMLGYQHVFGK